MQMVAYISCLAALFPLLRPHPQQAGSLPEFWPASGCGLGSCSGGLSEVLFSSPDLDRDLRSARRLLLTEVVSPTLPSALLEMHFPMVGSC